MQERDKKSSTKRNRICIESTIYANGSVFLLVLFLEIDCGIVSH